MTAPRIRRTHIALFVRDPFASAAWYETVLGMTETARDDENVFLSFGTKHHDIALIPATKPFARGTINMQHYAFEIDGDIDDLRRLYGRLLQHETTIVKVTNHVVGTGVYFSDPDGHRFEFFCETVHDDDEGRRLFNEHNAPSIPTTLEPLFP
jgi:catechol 2,3-dioxygenase